MSTTELHVSDDIAAAAWIAPRLTGEFGAVARTVPSGYLAHARICHPARDGVGAPTAWSTVAQATGRRSHPLMQWHALVGSHDPVKVRGSLWPGEDPQRGHVVPEVLDPLCGLLARHTTTARDCFFCLWEGWGDDSPLAVAAHGPTSHHNGRITTGPARVHHPGRDYHLLAGPLHEICARHCPDSFGPQSPNLMWPADQAWCLATEVDFDSTLIGGSIDLVHDLLEAPELDSWPVRPDHSLAADADHINSVP